MDFQEKEIESHYNVDIKLDKDMSLSIVNYNHSHSQTQNQNYKYENIDKIISLTLSNNITSLIFYNISISDISFLLLRNALITNTKITNIEICHCFLSDIGAIALSEVINSTYININNNKNNDKNNNKNKGNKSIASIILNVFAIGKIGINALLKAIKNNSYILHFTLCKINNEDKTDIEGLELIADIFEHNNTLVVFSIDKVISFYDEEDKYDNILKYKLSIEKFANALKINKTLEYLGLICNSIGDNDIKIICDALEHNLTIKSIDISRNNITDIGVVYLAEYLKNNTSLEYINLNSNDDNYTFDGIKILIEALQYNSTLLGCCFITEFNLRLHYELTNWCNDEVYVNEDGTLYIDTYTQNMLTLVNMITNVKSLIYTIVKSTTNFNNGNYYQYWFNNCMCKINHKTKLLLEFEKQIDKNKDSYETVYWNPWEHLLFKNIEIYRDYIIFPCHQLVITSLICNTNLIYKLPIQIWQFIFSFYQKKQFLYN